MLKTSGSKHVARGDCKQRFGLLHSLEACVYKTVGMLVLVFSVKVGTQNTRMDKDPNKYNIEQQAGMIGFITLQQSAPSQMTY